mmetsp:Transcript_68526/g.154940  ORF Transcript_68526/g.154940 Transcript_68526/m.154940 type:complete len:276 (+) Transcript_68526:548-1375(+)
MLRYLRLLLLLEIQPEEVPNHLVVVEEAPHHGVAAGEDGDQAVRVDGAVRGARVPDAQVVAHLDEVRQRDAAAAVDGEPPEDVPEAVGLLPGGRPLDELVLECLVEVLHHANVGGLDDGPVLVPSLLAELCFDLLVASEPDRRVGPNLRVVVARLVVLYVVVAGGEGGAAGGVVEGLPVLRGGAAEPWVAHRDRGVVLQPVDREDGPLAGKLRRARVKLVVGGELAQVVLLVGRLALRVVGRHHVEAAEAVDTDLAEAQAFGLDDPIHALEHVVP